MPACVAYGCTNHPDKDRRRGITFHKFPSEDEIKQQWISSIRRENFVPSKRAVVCSAHFKEECMDRTSLCYVRLRERAVPTIFNAFPPHLQRAEKWRKAPAKRTSEPLSVCPEYPLSLNEAPSCSGDSPDKTGLKVGMDYVPMGSMRPMIPQTPIPVNPDVKLKALPFYDVLGELMKPSSLIPKNSGRMQETLFVFHLTPQQAQDITMSRDFRPGARTEYSVQVQVRFCLLETTCEQADTFPSQIQVRVNNKPATLPNVIPTNKPNVEPKRPGRPVDITTLCRLSPTVSNAITVTWAADISRSFCMSVYLVRKLSSDTLLGRLKQYGSRHSDHTKALIKEKLAQDPDSEIATTSLRVSLMCPLGKMRMQIPCRASTCTHLQCFDASTFLMMNERKPTWMCPVCDRQCPYDKLIIDGYFVEIFRQAPPSCSEIKFHDDGSWSPMKPQKTESSQQVILTTTQKSSSSVPVSSSSSSSHSASHPSVTSTTASSAAPLKPAASKGPVIDLTLDSSDDDDDDAVIASGPVSVSPPPVINLDTPSPAPLPTMPSSPTVVLSNSQSPVPSPAGSSHAPHPLYSPTTGYTSSLPQPAHKPTRESPSLGTVDSILSNPPSMAHASPSSSLQSQALNLEAMSDADFDEFLKGLSWGV